MVKLFVVSVSPVPVRPLLSFALKSAMPPTAVIKLSICAPPPVPPVLAPAVNSRLSSPPALKK